jgi:endonuclease YncB( thermonuclease family)
MAIQAKQSTWPFIALLLVAGGLWLKDQLAKKDGADTPRISAGWERIEGCRWVEHDRNDGDSFRLRLPDGKVEEFRLYFVDTPESEFRTYGEGRSNHKRIADQARALGIQPEQAVEVGKKAKALVHDWCARRELVIVTQWDDPFGDRRYHAFVEMPAGDEQWLHERLVQAGVARIHTKGSDLPSGTPEAEQEKHLRELEAVARDQRVGAWGMGD